MSNTATQHSQHFIDPSMDGVTHINVYSRGRTELGRRLSHFAKSPFTHPYLGPFTSMEGFWYFMRSGATNDDLRYVYGKYAKDVGKRLEPKWSKHFREDIEAANYQKIVQNEHLMRMLIESDMPFEHYYLHWPRGVDFTEQAQPPGMVIRARDDVWLSSIFDDIRTAIKEGRPTDAWLKAEERYKNALGEQAT